MSVPSDEVTWSANTHNDRGSRAPIFAIFFLGNGSVEVEFPHMGSCSRTGRRQMTRSRKPCIPTKPIRGVSDLAYSFQITETCVLIHRHIAERLIHIGSRSSGLRMAFVTISQWYFLPGYRRRATIVRPNRVSSPP